MSQKWIIVDAARSALSHVARKFEGGSLESGGPWSDRAAGIGSVVGLALTSQPALADTLRG